MAGGLRLEDCVNRSVEPVSADSLTLYRGQIVGFWNPGCRGKFENAAQGFEAALEPRGLKVGSHG